jgi:hypothetical protein
MKLNDNMMTDALENDNNAKTSENVCPLPVSFVSVTQHV